MQYLTYVHPQNPKSDFQLKSFEKVQFLRDGKGLLIYNNNDHHLKIFNIRKRRISASIPSWTINTSVFSSQGTDLFLGSIWGVVKQWDMAAMEMKNEIKNYHKREITKIITMEDDKYVGSVCNDGVMKIYDYRERKEFFSTQVSAYGVSSIAYSQQHKLIATPDSWDMKLWDIRKLEIPVESFQENKGGYEQCEFHPNMPDVLVMGGSYNGKRLWMWNVLNNQRWVVENDDSSGDIKQIKFFPNSHHIAYSFQNEVRIANPHKRRLIQHSRGERDTCDMKIEFELMDTIFSMDISPSGKQIAYGQRNRTIKIYDIDKSKLCEN